MTLPVRGTAGRQAGLVAAAGYLFKCCTGPGHETSGNACLRVATVARARARPGALGPAQVNASLGRKPTQAVSTAVQVLLHLAAGAAMAGAGACIPSQRLRTCSNRGRGDSGGRGPVSGHNVRPRHAQFRYPCITPRAWGGRAGRRRPHFSGSALLCQARSPPSLVTCQFF